MDELHYADAGFSRRFPESSAFGPPKSTGIVKTALARSCPGALPRARDASAFKCLRTSATASVGSTGLAVYKLGPGALGTFWEIGRNLVGRRFR